MISQCIIYRKIMFQFFQQFACRDKRIRLRTHSHITGREYPIRIEPADCFHKSYIVPPIGNPMKICQQYETHTFRILNLVCMNLIFFNSEIFHPIFQIRNWGMYILDSSGTVRLLPVTQFPLPLFHHPPSPLAKSGQTLFSLHT